MKNKTAMKWLLTALATASMAVGCAGGGKRKGDELSASGPNVVSTRSNPRTIELDRNFNTDRPAEVIADVKDFTSKITEVRLRFVRVPMEIPMENIGGTTWRARLSPQQLRTLAIGGETMTYEANVVARNAEGMVAVSEEPVNVIVKAPDLAEKIS